MKQLKVLSISSLILSLVVLGLILTKFTFAAITDGHFVHSCVKNSNGSIRIVEASNVCAGNETALKWNSDGVDDFGGFTTKNLDGIFLGSQKLSYRNFKNGSFILAIFSSSDVSHTSFKNANLTNAEIVQATANGADFTNANFTGASLGNTDFGNADFTGVNMSNANLSGAIGMSTANRVGVIWSNTICPDTTNSDSNSNTCEGHLIP